MSHPRDIDEHRDTPGGDGGDGAGHGAGDSDALLLVDLLYGELSDEERESAEARVRGDDALAHELDSLSRLRSLMRELPDEEPPAELSAKLLHAAATAVRGSEDSAAGEERPSIWARLKDLLAPVALHPGLAAAASLVLVVGLAGTLLLTGRAKLAEPTTESMAPAPATTPAGDTAGSFPTGAAAAPEPAAQATPPQGALAEQAKDEAGGEPAGIGDKADDMASGAADPAQAQQAEGADGVLGGLVEQKEMQGAKRGSATAGSAKPMEPMELDTAASPRRSRAAASNAEPAKSKTASRYDEKFAEERAMAQEAPAVDLADSDMEREVAEARGKGSSAGGGGAPSTAAAPPPMAAPRDELKKAPPPPPAMKKQEAPAKPGRAAPAPEAAPPAAAPAPTEAAPESAGKADSSASNTRARAESLYREAIAAAEQGDCTTVFEAASRVRSLDQGYYNSVFAKHPLLRGCMSKKPSKKK